ncbi:DNA invertase [Cellulosimicrobium sp. TH-20]|nr:DNA invertase [Cellulosimicrobium sp. TH-20]
MVFGYARVSTKDQNPDHQVDALLRAGISPDDIHVDHASGSRASRPEFDILMRRLREGDVIAVTRLDRLSRSVQHLINLSVELRDRGIGLRVLEQGIDTSTPEGRAMFGMLSVLAELQREIIVANTRDGLEAARARGRRGGRKRRLSIAEAEMVATYWERGVGVSEIARRIGAPRTTVYGYLPS